MGGKTKQEPESSYVCSARDNDEQEEEEISFLFSFFFFFFLSTESPLIRGDHSTCSERFGELREKERDGEPPRITGTKEWTR